MLLACAGGPLSAQQIPTLDPTAAVAHYGTVRRARALYAEGHYAEAESLLSALVREASDNGELWYILARAHDRQGEARAAINAYRHSAEAGYGAGPWAAHRIAELYAVLGVADSALEWLSRSLALRWDDRPGIAEDDAFATLRDDPRFQRLAGMPAITPGSRNAGWRQDVDYLVHEAKRMHAGPEHLAFSTAFASAARALKARVPELTNDQIVMEMRAILVTLGDGHSAIYGPGPDSPLTFDGGILPLEFHEFTDGLYVIDGVGALARYAGARVLRFGDVPAERALAELARYTNHDNAMTVRWLGDFFILPTLDYLRAIGAAGAGHTVTLTLRETNGVVRTLTVEAPDGPLPFPRKLRPPPDQSHPPLYLSQVDTNYWMRSLPDHDAVYFQFNQVRDRKGGLSIAQFADSLRFALVRTHAHALIVDVRHNNGGNNSLVRPLVRALVWWELADSAHRVFVITGRNTFSAAQNFINQLDRITNAVFVGEASSSSPNFTGEETSLILPYSRVVGSISTQYWQDSNPDDTRLYIEPDIPVGLSSVDYFAGRDPALEAIFQLIEAEL